MAGNILIIVPIGIALLIFTWKQFKWWQTVLLLHRYLIHRKCIDFDAITRGFARIRRSHIDYRDPALALGLDLNPTRNSGRRHPDLSNRDGNHP